MKLNDFKIKSAKIKTKPYKLFDGLGLYLAITPNGSKRWRLKYYFLKKEHSISFGAYPEVSLKDAREKRSIAKKQLANDINPLEARKDYESKAIMSNQNTFDVVTQEWLENKKNEWVDANLKTVTQRLNKNVLPFIGKKPIDKIDTLQILSLVRVIEKRGAYETAHRTLSCIGQIFRYAVITKRVKSDPTRDLRGSLKTAKVKHMPAYINPQKIKFLLSCIDNYHGSIITKLALKLAPLVFVRPGELRNAKWENINFTEKQWCFISSKTKTNHIVPLSKQSLSILKKIESITKDNSMYAFPSLRTNLKPMSEGTLRLALRSLDIPKEEMSIHGFRAMARTLLDEKLKFKPEYIEQQLAHAVKDPLGRAYNRTKHLDERTKMMQDWADYLELI